ncbi:MAG: glyoxylate/hydroxypyruvate reductase GhrB [Pantoea sp.]|uniref:glyoxylate/hydroxypyruvate reductase GhrB n=1 Tax=Pantoea sp. TaxID=69393 RepID=UPI002398D2FD|nr:glyoxylate/hydroxypyruvate reductase GhrB [Pantoea sp.]MDE1188735.1 glyoxylate/hydroxypyruvate reductase GhrB [Pantoea sp.]
MKPAVIVYKGQKSLPEELYAKLDAHFTVTEVNDISPETVNQHAALFQQAEGLLGSGGKVNADLLAKMPALRACSTISVGYDNFDVAALNQRGVVLMHTPTVLTETVADTMMALVLSSARRVTELDAWVKAGQWQKSIGPEKYGVDVHHKTLGILGMGRIGLALAQRAHFGFGMKILYNARRQHSEAETRFGARACNLETLLKESDFVCISLPLTEQTHHMISTAQLKMMKPSAILINAGRGPVVDEQALITALQDGTIHAAGLDVFEQEPVPADSALLKLPNVVTLPHIGSATHETRYGMLSDAVDNLIAALTGKIEKNCVNPEVVK